VRWQISVRRQILYIDDPGAQDTLRILLIAQRYDEKELLVWFDGDKQAIWVFLTSKGRFKGLLQAGHDVGVDGLPNLRRGKTLGGRDSEQCPIRTDKKHISCADGPYLEQHVTDTKRFQVRSLE
jgi:hypothetical protein